MIAKEKANDLVKKYWLQNRTGQDDFKTAIKNALICVDEIINTISLDFIRCNNIMQTVTYWQEVKEEIIKL